MVRIRYAISCRRNVAVVRGLGGLYGSTAGTTRARGVPLVGNRGLRHLWWPLVCSSHPAEPAQPARGGVATSWSTRSHLSRRKPGLQIRPWRFESWRRGCRLSRLWVRPSRGRSAAGELVLMGCGSLPALPLGAAGLRTAARGRLGQVRRCSAHHPPSRSSSGPVMGSSLAALIRYCGPTTASELRRCEILHPSNNHQWPLVSNRSDERSSLASTLANNRVHPSIPSSGANFITSWDAAPAG